MFHHFSLVSEKEAFYCIQIYNWDTWSSGISHKVFSSKFYAQRAITVLSVYLLFILVRKILNALLGRLINHLIPQSSLCIYSALNLHTICTHIQWPAFLNSHIHTQCRHSSDNHIIVSPRVASQLNTQTINSWQWSIWCSDIAAKTPFVFFKIDFLKQFYATTGQTHSALCNAPVKQRQGQWHSSAG